MPGIMKAPKSDYSNAVWFVTKHLIATLIEQIVAAQSCTTPFSPRLVQSVDPTLDRVSNEFVTSSLTFCKALSGLRFSTLSPVTEDFMDGLTGDARTDLLLTFGPAVRSKNSWYDSLHTSSPRLQEERQKKIMSKTEVIKNGTFMISPMSY